MQRSKLANFNKRLALPFLSLLLIFQASMSLSKKKTIGDHSIHSMVASYFVLATFLPFLTFSTDCNLFIKKLNEWRTEKNGWIEVQNQKGGP